MGQQMRHPGSFLGSLTQDEFLTDYWQKKPLLCRQALPNYTPPLSAEELAGLSCETDVEARIVIEQQGHWTLRPGPFSEETFAELPARDWTLLVQDLDQHVPEVAELLERLDFLPQWRVDDVMASYAAPGGSVGPHFDQYDVFLLQVTGQRQWQISEHFDRARLLPDCELSILKDFKADNEWILNPGDMLYLPPHVAHYGRATTECVTFSLGCRAPSAAELITQVALNAIEGLDEHARYADADLGLEERKSGLSAQSVGRAQALLRTHLSTSGPDVELAMAQLVTQPKALFAEAPRCTMTRQQAMQLLTESSRFTRLIGSRWCTTSTAAQPQLIVNGKPYSFPPSLESLAVLLCETRSLTSAKLRAWLTDDAGKTLLANLVSEGLLEHDP